MNVSDILDLNWYCFSDVMWDTGLLWVINSGRCHCSNGPEMVLFFLHLLRKVYLVFEKYSEEVWRQGLVSLRCRPEMVYIQYA